MTRTMGVAVCLAGLIAAPSLAHAWGAVAVGKNLSGWGMTWNYTTKKAAGKAAIDYCKQYGQNCRVVGTFKSEWGSIATGYASGKKKVYGFGKGKSEKSAAEAAMKLCKKAGGKVCVVQYVAKDGN